MDEAILSAATTIELVMHIERILLSPARIAKMEPVALMLGLLAMGYLGGCAAAGQVPPGLITALAVIVAMANAGCIESRERERGVWMLCALIVVFFGAIGTMCAIGIASDLLAGRGKLGMYIDFGCALVVLMSTLWVVASAGYWNWRQFRSGVGLPPESSAGVPSPREPRRPVLSAHAMQEEAGR